VGDVFKEEGKKIGPVADWLKRYAGPKGKWFG
jgi:hypothetical protein